MSRNEEVLTPEQKAKKYMKALLEGAELPPEDEFITVIDVICFTSMSITGAADKYKNWINDKSNYIKILSTNTLTKAFRDNSSEVGIVVTFEREANYKDKV
ncbi:hypothetical protein ACZ11_07635 [Lysinibacillus xylanilyticus]|uniref:Uncharacterized protein n=1 Tax=Lysinibacillus xylanilyticus TaxID=582475 RepID=A0A0K9FCU6_9BACI|nr:hypothetical protein [Lysinibacillus xylanilyticus]KMY32033.1 hypothetical protein ACZ11_07635 [Lysinibacillus xylanilyticus]